MRVSGKSSGNRDISITAKQEFKMSLCFPCSKEEDSSRNVDFRMQLYVNTVIQYISHFQNLTTIAYCKAFIMTSQTTYCDSYPGRMKHSPGTNIWDLHEKALSKGRNYILKQGVLTSWFSSITLFTTCYYQFLALAMSTRFYRSF